PPRGAEHPKLAQKNQAFEPRVVVIPVGGTVDFPNLDPIYHNVFSVSPTRRFDLGKYPRGQSRSITFTRPRQRNVFSDIPTAPPPGPVDRVVRHPQRHGGVHPRGPDPALGAARGRRRLRARGPRAGTLQAAGVAPRLPVAGPRGRRARLGRRDGGRELLMLRL